jgi:hypothetical protein
MDALRLKMLSMLCITSASFWSTCAACRGYRDFWEDGLTSMAPSRMLVQHTGKQLGVLVGSNPRQAKMSSSYRLVAQTQPYELARAILRCFQSFSELGGYFLTDFAPQQFTLLTDTGKPPKVYLVDAPDALTDFGRRNQWGSTLAPLSAHAFKASSNASTCTASTTTARTPHLHAERTPSVRPRAQSTVVPKQEPVRKALQALPNRRDLATGMVLMVLGTAESCRLRHRIPMSLTSQLNSGCCPL